MNRLGDTRVDWGFRDKRSGQEHWPPYTEEYARDHVTNVHPGRCVLLKRTTVIELVEPGGTDGQ